MAITLSADFVREFQGGPTISAVLELPLTEPAVTVLFGPSGSGKTTILRCLAGLDTPTRGSITYGDQVWYDQDTRLRPQRRKIGYLAQRYALFPHLTVAGNIGYGLGGVGVGVARGERHERVASLVDFCGLAGLEHRRPRELSGGQCQRVALARALAGDPRLILLDEPLAALDAPMRAGLARELRELLVAAGLPTVAVTHDRNEALVLGDELVLVDDGHVIQNGPVAEVFNRPANVAAARIVGVETVVPARVVGRDGAIAVVTVGAGMGVGGGVGDVGLVALDTEGLSGDVWACIRAEDVIVESAGPSATTARNQLRGTIQAVVPQDPLVRIDIDCGFPLAAAVTKLAAEELALHAGQVVTAVIKAPKIHLVAHVT